MIRNIIKFFRCTNKDNDLERKFILLEDFRHLRGVTEDGEIERAMREKAERIARARMVTFFKMIRKCNIRLDEKEQLKKDEIKSKVILTRERIGRLSRRFVMILNDDVNQISSKAEEYIKIHGSVDKTLMKKMSLMNDIRALCLGKLKEIDAFLFEVVEVL